MSFRAETLTGGGAFSVGPGAVDSVSRREKTIAEIMHAARRVKQEKGTKNNSSDRIYFQVKTTHDDIVWT